MFPEYLRGRTPQIFAGTGGLTTTEMPGYVWHKPPRATLVGFWLIGAGGPGSSGSAASATAGSGGGSGASNIMIVPALFLPDILYLIPGWGGRGSTTPSGGGLAATPTVIKNSSNIVLASAAQGATGAATGGAGGATASCITHLASLGGVFNLTAGTTGGTGGTSAAGAAVTATTFTCGGSGGGGGANAGGNVIPLNEYDAPAPNNTDIISTISGGAANTAGRNGVHFFSKGAHFTFMSVGGTGAGGHATAGTGLHGGNGGLGSGGGGTGGQLASDDGSRAGRGGDGVIFVWTM